MELDTGSTGNFISISVWEKLGKPALMDSPCHYKSATNHSLPVLGTFTGVTVNPENSVSATIDFTVTKIPDLNLLGQEAIHSLGISLDSALKNALSVKVVHAHPEKQMSPVSPTVQDKQLQRQCQQLCEKFPDIFKEELGCFKDFELEVKFKSDAKPIFCKPRPVPFAIREDLSKGYKEGIAKGVWKPVQFNDYGTPVVPHRKALQPGQLKPKIRICGD